MRSAKAAIVLCRPPHFEILTTEAREPRIESRHHLRFFLCATLSMDPNLYYLTCSSLPSLAYNYIDLSSFLVLSLRQLVQSIALSKPYILFCALKPRLGSSLLLRAHIPA